MPVRSASVRWHCAVPVAMRTQVSYMRQSLTRTDQTAGGGMVAKPDSADNTVPGTDVTLLTDLQRAALVHTSPTVHSITGPRRIRECQVYIKERLSCAALTASCVTVHPCIAVIQYRPRAHMP